MVKQFDYSRSRMSLFEALLDAKKKFGGKKVIIEDIDRNPLEYDKVILSSLVLGRKLAKITSPNEVVGLLIASSVGATVAFMGLMAFGRTAGMLNFTAGHRNIRSACEAAQIKTIVTARRFITHAGLEPVIEVLEKHFKIVYLEDIRESISAIDKVRGLSDATFPKLAIAKTDPDAVAVMLFTSGTEGAPKGVALSHANLLANIEQVAATIDLLPTYVTLCPLPVFHSMGLTGGALLPLISGMRGFLFPSPLQSKVIVKLVKEIGASILFGTDTFINQYTRVADEGDLSSLKFIVAGAEKVKPETRDLLMTRFGVPIVEGYGATEASPVIAINTPDEKNRPGTVGRFVPAMQWKLESVPGIGGGGRLYVKGPNVMKGYVRVDAPGELQPYADGWHDTGDVVSIDDEGYITIRGRLKRFAKIGGEMVSLTAVEGYATNLWPDNTHVAISLNDPKKGEQIVLLTDLANADKSALQNWYRANGANELSLPKRIIFAKEIPILGTGKVDYVNSQKIAEASVK